MAGSPEALKKVAALDARLFEIEHKQKQIPLLLRRQEESLDQARQRLAAKDVELKNLRVKTELREKELRDAEQAVIKLRHQINQAKSNKEFQALQHEILAKEADNDRLEEAVLQQMQKLDRIKEERDVLAQQVKKAEADLDSERQKLEKEEQIANAQAEQLRELRKTAAADITSEIFAKYERLISRRGQTAMVAVVGGTCQGCFMTMRPETVAQLKKGGDLVVCHSCGRILYLEE